MRNESIPVETAASDDMSMIQGFDMSGNQTKAPPNTPKEDDKDKNPAAGSNGDSKKPPRTWDFLDSWEPDQLESSGFPPEDSK